MRKPTDPPLDDPKAGKLLGQCKEEDATLRPTSSQKIVAFHIKTCRNVCWNRSSNMFIGQIQYVAGKYGKKEIVYHFDYIKKL